ncbi:MAG: 2-oxoacid:acceptor oxidoreductase family protein [Elusimicrobiota bacterium]
MHQFSKIVSVVIVFSFLFSSLDPNYLMANYLRPPDNKSSGLKSLVSRVMEGKYHPLIAAKEAGSFKENILGPLAILELQNFIKGQGLKIDQKNVKYTVISKGESNIGLAIKSKDKNLFFTLPNVKAKEIWDYLQMTTSISEKKEMTYEELPEGGRIEEPGSSEYNKTGDWGKNRPEINFDLCTNCKRCVMVCPDEGMVMDSEGKILGVDKEYCKSCALCAEECLAKPQKAIKMVDKAKLAPRQVEVSSALIGKHIEVIGKEVELVKELLREKGEILPSLDNDILQIEFKPEIAGQPALLATFIKKGKGWSLIVQPKKTVLVYGLNVENDHLAQELRSAGYEVIRETDEQKLTELLNSSNIGLVVSARNIELKKRREIFNNYGLLSISPDRFVDSGDRVLDNVLTKFITAEKEEKFFAPGHRMCSGCAAPIITKNIMELAVKSGIEPIVGLATGCLEVSTTIFPQTTWKGSAIHVAFENLGAVLSGLDLAIKAGRKTGRITKNLMPIGFGGDGSGYDIGLQAESGWLERGHAGLLVIYDNGAYMNTGVQRSGATPFAALTTTTPAGKEEQRKNLMEIVKAHGKNVYVATVSPSHLPDFNRKVKKALEHAKKGPAVIIAYSSCPPGQRISSEQALKIAGLAVDTDVWPLYEYEDGFLKITYQPKEKKTIIDWLKVQGRFKHLFGKEGEIKKEFLNLVQQYQEYIEDWQTEIKDQDTLTRQKENLAIEIIKKIKGIEKPDEKLVRLLLPKINVELLDLYKGGKIEEILTKTQFWLSEIERRIAEEQPKKMPVKKEVKSKKIPFSINRANAIHNIKQLKGNTVGVVWFGRGGQGAVTTAEIFSESAKVLGFFSEAFPQFGPERTGAPVKAFNKIKGGKIREHSALTQLDISVVLDVSLMKSNDYLNGLRGDGVVIVNTKLTPQELRDQYKIKGRKIYTVDASGISPKFINTPMLGALLKSLNHFGLKLEVNELMAYVEGRFAYRYGEGLGKDNREIVEKAFSETNEEEAAIGWRAGAETPSITENEIEKILKALEGEVWSGNEAAAYAIKGLNPAVASMYPITPSTKVAEMISEFAAKGEIDTEITPTDSEHTAISVCVAAAQSGVGLVVDVTSSQGLVIKQEIMPIAAMTRSPILMIVASRAISGNINIHGDVSDVMFSKDAAGWITLFARNPQEAYDKTIIGGALALKMRLPVMVVYMGFETSHTKSLVSALTEEEIKKVVGEANLRPNLLEDKITVGPLDLQDYYLEHRVGLSEVISGSAVKIKELFEDFEKISGRKYQPISGYKLEDAELVLVSLAFSTAETAEETVDELRAGGIKAGLLNIEAFRPFPAEAIAEALKGKKVAAVLDRSDSLGGQTGPLFTEITTALEGLNTLERPLLIDYVMGLGGRDINTKDISELYEDMLLIESMKFKDENNLGFVAEIISESVILQRMIGKLVNIHLERLIRHNLLSMNKEAIVKEMSEYKTELIGCLQNMNYIKFLGLRSYRGVREEYKETATKRELLKILELERARRSLEKADNDGKRHDNLIKKFFANLDSSANLTKLVSITAGLMFIAGAMFNPELRNNLLQILGLAGSGAIGMFVYKKEGLERGIFTNKNLFNKLSFISL